MRRYPLSLFLNRFLALSTHAHALERQPVQSQTEFVLYGLQLPRRDSRVVSVRESRSAASALPRSHSRNANPSVATAAATVAADRRYVNSFCLSRAHTCSPSATPVLRDRRRRRDSAFTRATTTWSRYRRARDLLHNVTERHRAALCRNGCAGDATQAREDTARGVPRAAPFSLPLTLSLSLVLPLYRSLRRARSPCYSFLIYLVARRPVGDRKLFAGFYRPRHGREALSPPTTLLLTLLTLYSSSFLSLSPGSLSLFPSLRSAHARPLSVFRLVARSADIGGPRTPSFTSARGDMTLAWLLPWRLATDAAGAWDSSSTICIQSLNHSFSLCFIFIIRAIRREEYISTSSVLNISI